MTANAQPRNAGERISVPPNAWSSGCNSEDALPSEELRDQDFIAIERSTCFGPCPSYTVTIHANGLVSWDGRANVTQTGSVNAQIPSDAARSVIEKFQAAGFWTLCAKYDRLVTDVPTAITTLHIGDHQKSVSDPADGAPEWLRKLDNQAELLADVHRWIHSDPTVEVFARFLYADSHIPKLGVTALMRASAAGDVAEIQRQLATGADSSAQDCSGWTALMYATLPIKSEAIALLLRAGSDVNAISRMDQTALMAASLTFSGTEEKVELLLAAGARKDARDARNMSAFDYFDSTARNWPSPRNEEYEKVRLLLK
jgi:hypothetical protein